MHTPNNTIISVTYSKVCFTTSTHRWSVADSCWNVC